MKSLKNMCNVNITNSLHSLLEDSILADVDNNLVFGDKQIKKPEIALNKSCNNFEEIVELVADYFGVQKPKIKKSSAGLKQPGKYGAGVSLYNDPLVQFDIASKNNPNLIVSTIILAKWGKKLIIQTKGIDYTKNNKKPSRISGLAGMYDDESYKWGEMTLWDWIKNLCDKRLIPSNVF
jgi:hypothetical protein